MRRTLMVFCMDTRLARRKLGQRMRGLRNERMLTIRSFATMAGLNSDYVVDLEFGRKSATLNTLLRISSGLNVSLAELFEDISVLEEGKTKDFSLH